MAASQGRSADEPRTNAGVVYVSLTTKTESTAGAASASKLDIQPRCSPLACALADAGAP